MPELPEVETTCRGIAPFVNGEVVSDVIVREHRLRQPVSKELPRILHGQRVQAVSRRAKYLLLRMDRGHLLLHLGMSGSLRTVAADTPPQRHDHVDIVFGSVVLRLRDPRRFGMVVWMETPPAQHPLLSQLGPEPLGDDFNAPYLYRKSRKRRVAIKQFIMNANIVAGVGNIYASEALFRAGIRPTRAAGRISAQRYARLVTAIRSVLNDAIRQGGTTLRDFQRQDGRPGYFAQQLQVYGREGEPCPACGSVIRALTIGQRSSYFCAKCQR
ncbi:MAG: bifunctional DNA-formamidopyrimidine glycosylase/DNA-(apurinic or apyrimidinic site) lyase [Pseudomonadota bacterium]